MSGTCVPGLVMTAGTDLWDAFMRARQFFPGAEPLPDKNPCDRAGGSFQAAWAAFDEAW